MNKNSALLWFPAVRKVGFPYPKTIMVEYDHQHMIRLLEGEELPPPDELIEALHVTCQRIGYPCFIRTDLSSAKHDGPSAYKAEDRDSLARCLYRTAEDNEIKFWLSDGPKVIMVREFLELEAPFTAFDNLPIAREWRLFANADKLICAHPYWPEDALIGVSGPDNWRELLSDLHEKPKNMDLLAKAAIDVAKECDMAMSVDFACDVDGKWWLIDCASMENSWHWHGCENAVRREKKGLLAELVEKFNNEEE